MRLGIFEWGRYVDFFRRPELTTPLTQFFFFTFAFAPIAWFLDLTMRDAPLVPARAVPWSPAVETVEELHLSQKEARFRTSSGERVLDWARRIVGDARSMREEIRALVEKFAAATRRAARVGFDAIELISSSHLKKCVRELKEDPWARVRLVRERVRDATGVDLEPEVHLLGARPRD